MADPMQLNNLTGTLVLAASGSTGSGVAGPVELNLPISTTVANGQSLTSADVAIPGQALTCIFMVQMSSGTHVVTIDRTTDGTSPTYSSGNKVQRTVIDDAPIFLNFDTEASTVTNTNGVITVTEKLNVVGIKITNNSGVTRTLQQLRLLVLAQLGSKNIAHNSRIGAQNSAASDCLDSSGVFDLNT